MLLLLRGELEESVNADEMAANLLGIVFALRVKWRANESTERIVSFTTTMGKFSIGSVEDLS